MTADPTVVVCMDPDVALSVLRALPADADVRDTVGSVAETFRYWRTAPVIILDVPHATSLAGLHVEVAHPGYRRPEARTVVVYSGLAVVRSYDGTDTYSARSPLLWPAAAAVDATDVLPHGDWLHDDTGWSAYLAALAAGA